MYGQLTPTLAWCRRCRVGTPNRRVPAPPCPGRNHRVMAQRVSVLLVDDLDGGTADGTVAFALDGRRYEIDLSTDNERLLRAALEPFIAGARRASRGQAAGAARGGRQRPAVADGSATEAPEDGLPAEAREPEQPAEQPADREEPAAPNAVPQATFSSSATQPATRRGTATRQGSVEIFTHRA